jgi:hypothetical protein
MLMTIQRVFENLSDSVSMLKRTRQVDSIQPHLIRLFGVGATKKASASQSGLSTKDDTGLQQITAASKNCGFCTVILVGFWPKRLGHPIDHAMVARPTSAVSTEKP